MYVHVKCKNFHKKVKIFKTLVMKCGSGPAINIGHSSLV